MKRFWKNTQTAAHADGFTIELDGRPVKLPSGNPLAVASASLASAIATEWANAGEVFTPDDLPLTRLASTAQERIAPHRAEIIGQLAAYGMNDLLCYRAEAPEDLVIRQAEAWDCWLGWATATHDLRLLTTAGLIPIDQPPGTGEQFSKILSSYSDYTIAALGVIVPALGSLVLGLALTTNALDPDAACATALLDELWQEEQWGVDSQAQLRRATLREDVAISTRFIELCTI